MDHAGWRGRAGLAACAGGITIPVVRHHEAVVRQLESLPGGLGIVADDLMAGVYGALVLVALRFVVQF